MKAKPTNLTQLTWVGFNFKDVMSWDKLKIN